MPSHRAKSIRNMSKSKREIYSSIITDDGDYLDLLIKDLSKKRRSDIFTILYDCYNEAALRNVPLSDEIKLKVEVYCIQFYPHGDDATCWSVDLVLQTIREMRKKLDELERYEFGVDQRFLYIMTSLARDIHALKRLLKSSYDSIPWEEVEFCVAVFVLSRRSVSEINVYCHAYLRVERILAHLCIFQALLETFGKNLDGQTDLSKWSKMPDKRTVLVEKIRKMSPEKSLLYEDFNRLRDIHSLDTIVRYLDLVRSCDPEDLEGRLVILRSLQVVGEHLKNTLETPKLSQHSVDLIIRSMKPHTWKMVKQIRDNIFHHLLQIVSLVWDDLHLFVKVKDDLEKTRDVVRELLNHLKIKSFTDFINKFEANSDKDNETWDCLDFIDTDKFNWVLGNYGLNTTKLEDMIAQIRNSNSTARLKTIFDQVYSTAHSKVRKYEMNSSHKFTSIRNSLKKMKWLKHRRHEPQLQQFISKEMRIQTLPWSICPKAQNMTMVNSIKEHLTSQLNSTKEQEQEKEQVEAVKLIRNLTVDYGSAKNIQILGEKLEKLKRSETKSISINHRNEVELLKYLNFFEKKLELRNASVLLKSQDDPVTHVFTELYVWLKHFYLDGKRQTSLPDSKISFDKYPRILTGKSLRNHLAHNNIINEILLLDTKSNLIANAVALYEKIKLENVDYIEDVETISLFNNYKNDICIIEKQKELFDAILEGNINYMKKIPIDDIRIRGRDIKSMSILHYAVLSENHGVLERMFKLCKKWERMFKLSLLNSQDINLETPLHIAARLGRSEEAKFLLKLGARIDLTDRSGFLPIHTAAAGSSQPTLGAILEKSNDFVDTYKTYYEGFTPMHLAAMFGRCHLLEDLIKNNANVKTLSYSGVSPLRFALLNGREDVVRILVSKGAGVDEDPSDILYAAAYNENEEYLEYLLKNVIRGNEIYVKHDYSLLHTAALLSRRRLVEVILERYGVDVDATTLAKDTPLHYALVGSRLLNVVNNDEEINLAVIKLLIEKGCSLNAKSIDDVTPLFLSLDQPTSVTRLLLDSGADVNTRIMVGGTALHAAACIGNVETVNLLLERSCDISVRDDLGRSPLHVATTRDDNIDTVKLLIKRGLSIDTEDNEGNVPLHYAAAHNCETLIEFLLMDTNEVNKVNNEGYTPLHIAASGGFLNIVKALVDRGALVNVIGASGNSPLHLAVISGQIYTVKILVENNADINMKNENGLSPLALCGDISIVDFLLDRKALVDDVAVVRAIYYCHSWLTKLLKIFQTNNDLTRTTSTKDGFGYTRILCYACCFSTPNIVKHICKSTSVNVENELGWTPLHEAVWNGDKDIIDILLKQGADIFAKGKLNMSPLVLAIFKGGLATLKMFFGCKENVLDVDEMGNSLLHYAVLSGDESIVSFLLNIGADIKICNNAGLTSAHFAAVMGFHRIFKIFVSKKCCDFKVDRGPGGTTLLHLAAEHGNTELIKFILKYEIEVDVKDDNGDTPLNEALINGHKDSVIALLERGAQLVATRDCNILKTDIKNIVDRTMLLHHAVENNNVNDVSKCIADGAVLDAVNKQSETALHLAVRNGYEEIFKLLLENKCDPNVKDKQGVTALHLAAQSSNDQMVNHLLANGATYNFLTDGGETPFALTKSGKIKKTLKLIGKLFKLVKKSNSKLTTAEKKQINENPEILSILQNVKDRGIATIFEVANRSNFSDLNELKTLLFGKIYVFIDSAVELKNKGLYEDAIKVTNEILKDCQPKNLIVFWDLMTLKADLLRCVERYDSALTILNNLLNEQNESLGEDHDITLRTSSIKAESLMFSGRSNEALTIFQEIYVKRKNKNDKNDLHLYFTMVCIGKALNDLGKREMALRFSEEAHLEISRILGSKNMTSIDAEGVYAESLNHVGRYDEALKRNQNILDTLKELKIEEEWLPYITSSVCYNETLSNMGRCEEALKNFKRLLKAELQHPPSKARIQNNIINILSIKGESFKAFTLAKQVYDEASSILGRDHPEVTKIKDKIYLLENFDGNKNLEKMLVIVQKELMRAIRGGDEAEVKKLLMKGASPNIRDDDGRTALHWSVINGRTNITRMMLQQDANVSIRDNSNNTPLYYSIMYNFTDISRLLMENGAKLE